MAWKVKSRNLLRSNTAGDYEGIRVGGPLWSFLCSAQGCEMFPCFKTLGLYTITRGKRPTWCILYIHPYSEPPLCVVFSAVRDDRICQLCWEGTSYVTVLCIDVCLHASSFKYHLSYYWGLTLACGFRSTTCWVDVHAHTQKDRQTCVQHMTGVHSPGLCQVTQVGQRERLGLLTL